MKPIHYILNRLVACLALTLLFSMAAQADDELNPVADPEAVVTEGNVRFTVLTDRMIRIQYSSTAKFEDRATFAIVNRRLPVPHFTTEKDDKYLYIHTDSLDLRYRLGSVPKTTDASPNNLLITFSMNGFTCQ